MYQVFSFSFRSIMGFISIHRRVKIRRLSVFYGVYIPASLKCAFQVFWQWKSVGTAVCSFPAFHILFSNFCWLIVWKLLSGMVGSAEFLPLWLSILYTAWILQWFSFQASWKAAFKITFRCHYWVTSSIWLLQSIHYTTESIYRTHPII